MGKLLSISLLILFEFATSFSQANFSFRLCDEAMKLIDVQVVYDPSYFVISYPNGDIPANKGVCTDVIIRVYRKFGIDLQKLINEDIKTHFNLYPKNWGLSKPDKNIDHRRVPNLMVFFSRFGKVKPNSLNAEDYIPGDIVCWDLGGNITHIGFVVNKRSADGKRYMIIHNIGRGHELSDCLFDYKIIGHYQYPK